MYAIYFILKFNYKKEEILITHITEDRILDIFKSNTDMRKRYFSNFRLMLIEDFYVLTTINTSNNIKKTYFNKNIRKEKNFILGSIEKEYGTISLYKKNENSKFSLHTRLNNIDNINYTILDRVQMIFAGECIDDLTSDLERNLFEYNLDVYFGSAGEWLNIYPSEIVKEEIVEHKDLIIDFCDKRDLVFCYSEKYEYDKKLKKHVQKIDSIDPKLGFIKKESFDDWISMDVFTPKTITNDGIFYQYRTVREKEKDEFLIEHIFVQQFKNFKTKIKNIE